MIHVALLGFGVVGSGTAEVLTQNKSIIEKKVGQEIHIKYILDLRDFPDSPFADRIVHDFNTIVSDPEVSVVRRRSTVSPRLTQSHFPNRSGASSVAGRAKYVLSSSIKISFTVCIILSQAKRFCKENDQNPSICLDFAPIILYNIYVYLLKGEPL